MQEWTVPAWAVLAVVVGVLLLVAVLAVAALRAARRSAAEVARATSATESLRQRLEELERAPVAGTTESTPGEDEYVITRLGTDATAPAPAAAAGTRTVPGPLFADLVLRESVVQVASFAAGLRRALSPESRNRIGFEMRREVRRSRKQRRADLRAARPAGTQT